MTEAMSSLFPLGPDESNQWFDDYLERLQRVTDRFEDATGGTSGRRPSCLADVCLGPPEVVSLPVVAGWLREARRTVVLTGEGLAMESGVPTPGLRPGVQPAGLDEELAFGRALSASSTGTDPDMPALIPVEPLDARPATWQEFDSDPAAVWAWHRGHQMRCLRAKPSQAHRSLAELESLLRGELTLVTTAVDGLHLQAGSSQRNLHEVNGNIHRARCDEQMPRACLRQLDLDDQDAVPPARGALCAVSANGQGGWQSRAALPPPCPRCGVRRRPHVLWGGELRSEALYSSRSAQRAAERCDLLLVVGTGITRGLPAQMAGAVLARENGRVILVGTSGVRAPAGVLQLPGPLGETVTGLVTAVRISGDPAGETEEVIRAFRSYDVNGDGFISRDELHSVLKHLGGGGAQGGAAWADRILRAADLGKDGGRVDYADFLSWVMDGGSGGNGIRIQEPSAPPPKAIRRWLSVGSEASSRTSSYGTTQRSCSASSYRGGGPVTRSPSASSRSASRPLAFSRTPTPPKARGSKTPALPQIAATARSRSSSFERRSGR